MLYPVIEANLKNLNKRLCLELIRFTPGGISRADLARKLNITRSAVTAIINSLLDEELFVEVENSSRKSSGRKPKLLVINPDRGNMLGVDLGATHIGIIVTDFSGKVLLETEKPFDLSQGPEITLSEIGDMVTKLTTNKPLSFERILGVGVGVPGPVVTELGAVSAPPIMPGWGDFPIRETLHSMWKRPVSLNNDAELGALGEWALGAGRGERNLAYIKVGSGVGAGFIFDGNIYRGISGSAGEIGHVTMVENGPKCSCGSYGCLEAISGGFAIARQAREAVLNHQVTQLAEYEAVEAITARTVADAASRGDLLAQQIISKAGRYLGIAVASMINLLNPGMVVIGGGVAEIGDLLLDPIRMTVMERSLKSSAQTVRISAAVLGRRSTSIGAVVQATSSVLDDLFY